MKQFIGKVSVEMFMKIYKMTHTSLVEYILTPKFLILIPTLINRNVIRVFIILVETFELYYAFS